jgi:hypothetical protein
VGVRPERPAHKRRAGWQARPDLTLVKSGKKEGNNAFDLILRIIIMP